MDQDVISAGSSDQGSVLDFQARFDPPSGLLPMSHSRFPSSLLPLPSYFYLGITIFSSLEIKFLGTSSPELSLSE